MFPFPRCFAWETFAEMECSGDISGKFGSLCAISLASPFCILYVVYRVGVSGNHQ